MAIHIEVNRAPSESNMSVLRRFRKRVKDLGLVQHVRETRHRVRPASKFARKKSKLKRLVRGAEIARLIKLGKMTPNAPRA